MDRFQEANRPKRVDHYDAARDMFNYSARDVSLWIIPCIYKGKGKQTDGEFISMMIKEHPKLTNYDKKDLRKFENQQDINLTNCDVLMLKKIILRILETDYIDKSQNCEIKDMKVILSEFTDKRNGFDHADEEFVDITDEAEFNAMKDDFILKSEKLIYYSREMSTTKTIEEANNFFQKMKNYLNKNWPYKQKSTLSAKKDNGNMSQNIEMNYEIISNGIEDAESLSDTDIFNVMKSSICLQCEEMCECNLNKEGMLSESLESSLQKNDLGEIKRDGKSSFQTLMENIHK